MPSQRRGPHPAAPGRTQRPARTRVRTAAVAAVAAVCALAAAGCGSGGPSGGSSADSAAHSPYVRLTGGTYHGVGWQLVAWEQRSRLCMELLPAGASPDRPVSAEPSWPAAGGGGCAFDAKDPSSGYYASATGPAGSGFSYGPLPDRATRIRTAAHETLATSPLPRGKGLPSGRYWVHLMPAGWPTAAQGAALDMPQPLDARGADVAFRSF